MIATRTKRPIQRIGPTVAATTISRLLTWFAVSLSLDGLDEGGTDTIAVNVIGTVAKTVEGTELALALDTLGTMIDGLDGAMAERVALMVSVVHQVV